MKDKKQNILIELQAINAVGVTVQVHRASLALFPVAIELLLGPVYVLPVIPGVNKRNSQTTPGLDTSTRGISRRLFPQERLPPDMPVLDNMSPALVDQTGRPQTRAIELGEDKNSQLRWQLRDKVNLDNVGLLAAPIG